MTSASGFPSDVTGEFSGGDTVVVASPGVVSSGEATAEFSGVVAPGVSGAVTPELSGAVAPGFSGAVTPRLSGAVADELSGTSTPAFACGGASGAAPCRSLPAAPPAESAVVVGVVVVVRGLWPWVSGATAIGGSTVTGVSKPPRAWRTSSMSIWAAGPLPAGTTRTSGSCDRLPCRPSRTPISVPPGGCWVPRSAARSFRACSRASAEPLWTCCHSSFSAAVTGGEPGE